MESSRDHSGSFVENSSKFNKNAQLGMKNTNIDEPTIIHHAIYTKISRLMKLKSTCVVLDPKPGQNFFSDKSLYSLKCTKTYL